MVLRAEWRNIRPAMKTHLKTQVSECADRLKSINEPLVPLCLSILQLLDDPWGDNTLKSIIQGKPFEDSAGIFSFLYFSQE